MTLRKVEIVDCHWTDFSNSTFNGCISLEQITIPEGIIFIGEHCFERCSFASIKIPASVHTIGGWAFSSNRNLRSIHLSNLVQLGSYSIWNCVNLTTLFLPNTLKEISTNNPFQSDYNLTDVTLEDNFDCNNLNLSASIQYTHDTILSWFNALKDRTGESSSYKLIIGNHNLKKLTSEDIAIANNKNWTIV